MNQLFWVGAGLWFFGVGLIFASRLFRRWKDSVRQAAIVLSVLGAPILAITVPSISEDPPWQNALIVAMLVGWTLLGLIWIYVIRLAKDTPQKSDQS